MTVTVGGAEAGFVSAGFAAPPLDVHAPVSVPAGLKQCLLDCLAKSPQARPQTARELLARLQAAEAELPDDQRWTDERAQSWWQTYQPPSRASHPAGLSPSPQGQLRIADAG